MYFTQEDYKKIEEYLKLNSKKDSDFPSLNLEDPLNENDFITIVHNKVNHKVNLLNFADFLDSLLILYKYLTKIEELTEEERLALAKVDRGLKDLLNQIDSLDIHGIAVSNEFGADPHISVSQKTMTNAINKLWQKIEDITGEVLQGFSMQVTPEYYIGETGADIHILANTVEANGIFEHITIYGNGVKITEADNVDFFEYDFHIDETTVIQIVTKIMGVEYNRQAIITHYSSFLLGSGDSYTDLMDDNNRFLPQYVIPIANEMRGAYNVSVNEGKKIIIVVGESLAAGFIRADLNGVEIQFTESTCTDADGKVYAVFTSEPWSAGDYNINING